MSQGENNQIHNTRQHLSVRTEISIRRDPPHRLRFLRILHHLRIEHYAHHPVNKSCNQSKLISPKLTIHSLAIRQNRARKQVRIAQDRFLANILRTHQMTAVNERRGRAAKGVTREPDINLFEYRA